MTRHRWVVLILLAGLGLSACGSNEEAEMPSSTAGVVEMEQSAEAPEEARGVVATDAMQAKAAPGAPVPEPAPAANQAPVPAVTRKLVRTVDLSLEVKSTEEAAAAAQALANRVGGYVGNVEAERRDGVLYYRITLRVPVGQLDGALAEIKKMAVSVNHENQTVHDVTDQYVDLDARIRTLQATERELQALLAESRQRGSKVEDIMAVYRELTGIRSQIEQIQGQLKSLEQLAALSTINLTLNPVEGAKPVAPDVWNPGGTLRMSLRTLVTLLRAAGDFAIFAIVVLLPVSLAVWGVVWLVKKMRPARRPVTPPAAE